MYKFACIVHLILVLKLPMRIKNNIIKCSNLGLLGNWKLNANELDSYSRFWKYQ